MTRSAELRFYSELNDFLSPDLRRRPVRYEFSGTPAVKDAIEALGIPHPEVDLIVTGGESVGFDHRLSPGERIADLCAAPGGKTVYISEQMENTGRLLAADPSPARLNKLQETITRCGVANALVRRVDLLKKDPGRGEGLWDGILLDVPCSNTGVRRRRVDARWRIGYDDIIRLANQGLSLLAAAAGRLRAGGRIVYSTCSLEPEENEEAVKKFLQLRPDYSLEEEESGLPREEGGDGYYAARLRKAGLKPTG